MNLEQSRETPQYQDEPAGLGYYLKRFFGVIARVETYLNLLYLLLAFPLGLLYFISLVVGFSLGLGLLILLVGILILLITLAVWVAFGAFERQLAIWLLREDIPPMTPPRLRGRPAEDIVSRDGFMAYLTSPVTWTSLVYVLAKFPLGILSFVVLVLGISITGAFLTAPLTYTFVQPEVWFTWNSVWVIDTLADALLAFLIGIPLLFISLHVFNGLAWLSGKFARVMLGAARTEVDEVGREPEGAVSPPAIEEPVPGPEAAPQPAEEPETASAVEDVPEGRGIQKFEAGRMQTHVKVLGWLYLGVGVLGVLAAAFVFIVVLGSGLISGDDQAIAITGIVAALVAGFLLLVSAPGILAGVGLLYYRSWGRVLAVLLAILNLANFPAGTALGVYALWVLLQDETSRLFTI